MRGECNFSEARELRGERKVTLTLFSRPCYVTEEHVAPVIPTLVGIAGVHHVASELSRRGLIALPTTRNTAAYDIAVTTVDGKKHANVQVKASLKRVTFFPMPPSARVRAGPDDY